MKHVGRVLAKIGARDRIQAVVAAYEDGSSRTGHTNGAVPCFSVHAAADDAQVGQVE